MQFLGGRRHLKNPVYLACIRLKDDETPQTWLKRFSKATVEVGHLSDDALLLAANYAVCEDTLFVFSINKKPPRTYSKFLDQARNYINAEASTSKKSGAAKPPEETPNGIDGRRCRDLWRPPQEEASSFTMIRGIATHVRRTRRPELVNNGAARTTSLPPQSRRSSSTREARLTFDPRCQ